MGTTKVYSNISKHLWCVSRMAIVLSTSLACLGAVISPTRPPLARVQPGSAGASASRSTLPLRINNTWYDASAYAGQHAGGRWLLEYARGRDVTALFRATHLFGEQRAAAHLAKLPVLPLDEVRRDLKET